jgi:hypothetical protein
VSGARKSCSASATPPSCKSPPDVRTGRCGRSAYGTDNPWFRRATASGTGRIRAGGVERDVSFETAAANAYAQIDAAYHVKYDRYGPQIVGTVVGDRAAPTTLRLVPED